MTTRWPASYDEPPAYPRGPSDVSIREAVTSIRRVPFLLTPQDTTELTLGLTNAQERPPPNSSACCSSRSTPKPRPTIATARPNVTFETYACPEAYAKWYCLNGATCFAIKIRDSILYSALECADGFMGQRCEFKDLDGSYLRNQQRERDSKSGHSWWIANSNLNHSLLLSHLLSNDAVAEEVRRLLSGSGTGEDSETSTTTVSSHDSEEQADCKNYSNTWFISLILRWRRLFSKDLQSLTTPHKRQVAIVSQSPYLEHCNLQEHFCPERQGHYCCPNRQEHFYLNKQEHSYSHRPEHSHRH
ncbi:protein spitz [Caerostris extrusa]|uniref:Protein spitz n=1 Tax=Caerostris extrusa TaxID=172846 RepID=A0AAV4NY31_CAEEX|nr:protein spitz [Caerostris extrusa]